MQKWWTETQNPKTPKPQNPKTPKPKKKHFFVGNKHLEKKLNQKKNMSRFYKRNTTIENEK
jgi:hypothetical protein